MVPELRATYDPKKVVKGICMAAEEESWKHLQKSIKECNRGEIGKHYLFGWQKGRDMLLLECGCDVPVIDRWILRRFLQPKPELEEEFERHLKAVHSSPSRYGLYRDEMIAEAEGCAGVYDLRPDEPKVALHHVAAWLESLFGEDFEGARSYLRELFGPWWGGHLHPGGHLSF